jgi:hypothetical protein
MISLVVRVIPAGDEVAPVGAEGSMISSSSSFSALALCTYAGARAASVRVGRRRKANHLVRL